MVSIRSIEAPIIQPDVHDVEKTEFLVGDPYLEVKFVPQGRMALLEECRMVIRGSVESSAVMKFVLQRLWL
jgi:hypothetical protein